MQPDDVMPNDGSYFLPREPEDQIVERKKERALALEGMNFLQDMLKRLDQRIKFYQANSSIPDEVRTRPDEFLVLHNSYSLMASTLQSERNYLQSIIDNYKR